MVKRIAAAAAAVFMSACLFAYNPPAGGEYLFGISSPFQLTSAQSSAGGAFFDVTPASQVFNPALQAFEQRIMLDAGYTMLQNSDDPEHSFGYGIQGGMLFPGRWGVASGEVFVLNNPFYEMQTGKSLNLKLSAAKDVTDYLAVGMGLGAGYFWGYDKSWMAGVDLGVLYNYGDAGISEDVRFGVTLLNLGKTFGGTKVLGIYHDKSSGMFPGIATLRAGIAGTFLHAGDFKGAASFDVAVPTAQNCILDAGVQFMYRDFVKLSVAEEYNVREVIKSSKNWLPSIGLSFLFKFNSKDNAFMKRHGWQESEVQVGGAWKRFYDHTNAMSGGLILKLGLEDTEPPEITLGEPNQPEKEGEAK